MGKDTDFSEAEENARQAAEAEAADLVDKLLFEESAIVEISENTVRSETVLKAIERLTADAQRGEGHIARDDVNRTYHRLNLTIAECAQVEAQLTRSGIQIEDSASEEHASGKTKARYLSFAEEQGLARKIQLANKLQVDNDLPASERDRIIAEAEKAKELFVVSNHLWVRKLANGRRRTKHLSQDDLYQEGMLGLLRATKSYDPDLGFRFKTYATWWIEQHISRAIDNDEREVRLPVHLAEKLRKIRRAEARMLLETGKQPNIRLLADATGLDPERLGKLLWRVRATNVVEGDTELEDGSTIFEFVADDESPDLVESVAHSQLSDMLAKTLLSLTAREERILRLRFGVDLDSGNTLQTIGDQFGVTRERIRQIEAKALRKLKHPSRSRQLRRFLDD